MEKVSKNFNYKDDTFKIFVGGLPSCTENEDLIQFFSKYGELQACEVQRWRSKRRGCRGFALVWVKDQQTYDVILSSHHWFRGRLIECKRAFRTKEEAKKYDQSLHERKLFVKGLPSSVTTLELKSFFSVFGEVEIAYVVKSQKKQKSKGFGYVCFVKQEDCHKLLNKQEIVYKEKVLKCYPYLNRAQIKESGSEESQEIENSHQDYKGINNCNCDDAKRENKEENQSKNKNELNELKKNKEKKLNEKKNKKKKFIENSKLKFYSKNQNSEALLTSLTPITQITAENSSPFQNNQKLTNNKKNLINLFPEFFNQKKICKKQSFKFPSFNSEAKKLERKLSLQTPTFNSDKMQQNQEFHQIRPGVYLWKDNQESQSPIDFEEFNYQNQLEITRTQSNEATSDNCWNIKDFKRKYSTPQNKNQICKNLYENFENLSSFVKSKENQCVPDKEPLTLLDNTGKHVYYPEFGAVFKKERNEAAFQDKSLMNFEQNENLEFAISAMKFPRMKALKKVTNSSLSYLW